MLAKMEATPSVVLALTLLDFADESDIFTLEANNRKRRKHRLWVREWIQEREDEEQCNTAYMYKLQKRLLQVQHITSLHFVCIKQFP
jgi:predicted membrane chloride channel (bestrophin family)